MVVTPFADSSDEQLREMLETHVAAIDRLQDIQIENLNQIRSHRSQLELINREIYLRENNT
jgi:hypothetical protein